MDYLTEVKTVEQRDLILSEITALKRKDISSVRKSFLDNTATVDLNDLAKQLKGLDIVKIVLAVEPTLGIIEIIDNFFLNNLNKKVIFDFEVSKEFLAGLQIIYKGKYFNVSV